MKSPFAIFRKHQKVLMVILTGMAMFAFVIFDAAGTTGRLPPSLIFVTLVGVCAGILWIVGTQVGKPTEYAIAGAIIGLALGIVGQRVGGPQPVVETNVKNFSERELTRLVQRRQIANQFVREAFSRAGEDNMRRPPLFGFGHPPEQIEQDVLLGYLFRQEAEQLGIVVSDDAVTAYIKRMTSNNLGPDVFKQIRRDLRLSESRLYDILRDELKASLALQMLAPRTMPTPEQYWELYQKLNVQQELDVAAVPVSAFTEDVESAGDGELRSFFERYKTVLPNQNGDGDPGFRQPRKVNVAYIEADFETFKTKVPPVEDGEIVAFYEENKDRLYRNNPLPDDTGQEAEDSEELQDGQEPELKENGKRSGEPSDGSGPLLPEFSPDEEKTLDDNTASDNPQSNPQNGETGESEIPPPAGEAGGIDEGILQPSGQVEQELEAKGARADQQRTAHRPAKAKKPTRAAQSPGGPAIAKKPDDAPPAETEPLPEYRPLDDALKREIRDLLIAERTQAAMKQAIDEAIRDQMLVLGDRYLEAETAAEEAARKEEIAEQLRRYAEQHDLRYAETGLVSAEELSNSEEHAIGSATEPTQAEIQRFESRSVVSQMFESRPDQLYQPYEAQDPLSENRFAYWKIHDRAAHVPEFTDPGVKQQVLEAWKKMQARPLAQKRAEALKEQVGDQQMADVLIDETITGKKGGRPLTVLPTGRFSWMRTSSAPATGLSFMARPVLSEVSTVDGAGEEFMQFVFNELDPGQLGVVPNADRSIYYVVQVTDRVPPNPDTDELFKQRFMEERLFGASMFGPMFRSTYEHLTAAEQQELTYQWSSRLQQKYAVYWNPERLKRR